MFRRSHLLVAALVLTLCSVASSLDACPFCSAQKMTFSEEIAASDVAVFAKLVKPAPAEDPGSATNAIANAEFQITEVLKGGEIVGKNKKVETVYFGDQPVGAMFLVMGIDPKNLAWSSPIAVSERARKYIVEAFDLPKEGPDRLVYFQEYLEDSEDMLARDAYDEFAKAPFGPVKELGPRMHHDKLVKWIKDEKVTPSHRRLYLTMLSVCGTDEDAAMLEEMISSDDKISKTALDALLAAYLTLRGPEGMPLVEDKFLKNAKAEYTDTYSAIMALRFHGQEEKIIPKERLVEGFRHMLDRPQLADLVISDLARWEDWSVVDRLVEMFKGAEEDSSWARVPIINYLRACPLPKAKEHLAALSKEYPEVVKQANALFPLSSAQTPVGARPDDKKDDTKPDSAGATKTDDSKSVNSGTGDAKSPSGKAPPAGKSTGNAPVKTSAVRAEGTRLSKVEKPTETAVSTTTVVAGMGLGGVLLAGLFAAIFHTGQRTS